MTHELRIMIFIFLSMTLASLFMIQPVYAADLGPPEAGLAQIETVFSNVITAVVGLGFIACLVMLISAGFKYLTSGGEPKAISAAHQTFTWALLGIIIMAIAWVILLLIKAFTGIDVTTFNVKILCGVPNDLLKFCKP